MACNLQVEELTKSFGDLLLFNKISFGLNEGDKVGLIAKNGAGKTTLLQIISGHEGYDEGRITFRRDIRVGYLEQNPQYPAHLTVLEACFHHGNETVELIRQYEACLATEGNPGIEQLMERMDQASAWDYEQRAKQILAQLSILRYDQPVGELSGGQLKRVALANALITEPDLLILDEPTNHLDLKMIEWLEDYLKRSSLCLLMVTHDRYFLDRVCNSILEIDDQQIFGYKGNYSYYLEKRQERIDASSVQQLRASNLYRTELDWMRRMPQARGHKAKYREDAFYELEKVAKRNANAQNVELNVKASYIGTKIFEAEHLCKKFDDLTILDDFSYVFSRYEKMGIVGENGSGKSTFLKILMQQVPLDSGVLDIGQTVRFGYYSQDGLQFDEQMKVIDVVKNIAEFILMQDGSQLSASQLLQHFLFEPETQYNYVYKLSGGEKRRLYLCTVLMQNPNFLILDEPTNDLDIVTMNVLEEYLKGFQGCVIVVSHDRYFMDKLVDHLLVFNGEGDIRDFPGNYTQYREWKELQEEQLTAKTTQKASSEDSKSGRIRLNEKPRLSYKERLEYQALDKEIPLLEQQKTDLEAVLCAGTADSNTITEIAKQLAALSDSIDEKSMRWLELSELV